MKFHLFTSAFGILLLAGIGCDDSESSGTETQTSGVIGRDGQDGDDGEDGAKGEPGPPGAPGAAGEDGVDGRDGRDGQNGAVGATGSDGADGADGLDGLDGSDGDGDDGRDGRDGRDGVATVPPGDDDDDPVDEEEGPPEPQVVALSRVGHDRFFGVAYDAAGNLYTTGQIAGSSDAAADHSFFVAKLAPDGELDPSFGNDGVAIQNVAVGGTSRELARGIVVQSSGKIVIAGSAEHDPSAADILATDTDMFVVRFNADGTLDTTFGSNGVTRLDFNSGLAGTNAMGQPTLAGGDSQYALALAAGDKLYVHGTQRSELLDAQGTPRSDADWVLARLTADGVLDPTFSGDGKVTLNIGGAGAAARAVTVLADGSVIATGYLSSMVLQQNGAPVSTQQPVLYKVTAAGELDPTFATSDQTASPGVWHDIAVQPPLRAEAYGAALQGDKLVTMGYGPTPGTGTSSDWVSFRFTLAGERDTSYGSNGSTYLDAGGYGDNGRFVLVLPDDRVLGIGGGRSASAPIPSGQTQPGTDGMIAVLTPNGAPDSTFAPGGIALYDLGGAGDFFWAGAIAPDRQSVAVVGIAGAAATGDDDDGALLILPLAP